MEPIEIADITPDVFTGPFHARQKAAGASFYEDLGLLWTASFGDPVGEYWTVRRHVGLWDISALSKFRFTGGDALAALERLTTRMVTDASPGTMRYVILLDERGKMLDEGTVLVASAGEAYYFGNDQRDWFREHLDRHTHGLDVRIEPVSATIPDVAVQGPRSYELLSTLTRSDLSSLGWFRFIPEPIEVAGVRVLLARAGFTGELGYELYLVDGDEGAEGLWDAILDAGARPFGLDAVELLRLEAGLVIAEEDYWPGETDPHDLSLDGFIDLGHDFVGKEAASATAASPPRRFVTLEVRGDVAPEAGAPVTTTAGAAAGIVRSAGVTPRFGAIALAVVTAEAAVVGETVLVDDRDAVVHAVPIDDPEKLRPRADPRRPLSVE